MTIMGIDPSMRSTGICIRCEDKLPEYRLVCSTVTKKVRTFEHPRFRLHLYEPVPIKDLSGPDKELAKTINVRSVSTIISSILDEIRPDMVCIEALALHAVGRIDELAGLNYAIRLACLERGIDLVVLTPSANKKLFTGNGAATKDMMVSAWEASTDVSNLLPLGKHREDLADAYALSIVAPYKSDQ